MIRINVSPASLCTVYERFRLRSDLAAPSCPILTKVMSVTEANRLKDAQAARIPLEEAMATNVERSRLRKSSNREEFYSPDILPMLQTVLADLADIDVAFEKSLDAIKHSGGMKGAKAS
jgi:hypothetical protein